MNAKNPRTLVAVLIIFTLAFHLSLIQDLKAQQNHPSVRQRFIIVPAVQRCQPAEVKSISLGNQPLDALLAQVTVENHSDKVIIEVKLGWKVYDYSQGTRTSLSYCDAKPVSAEVFLAGTTPLIQLESLKPKETSNISTRPLVVPTPATKTVFVDHPLLTADDVKSLPLDDPTPKIKYAVVMYVSEVHYDDATTWEAAK
jgi:hypothetical protein